MERILDRTDCMQVLGNPLLCRSSPKCFHPFHPQRTVILPDHSYGDRCGGGF